MTTLDSRPPTYTPGQPGPFDTDVLTAEAPDPPADPDAAFSRRLAAAEAARAPALQRSTRAPRNPGVGVRTQSPSLVMLVLIATLGILAYASFLLNPESRGDWLPYTMVIIAEMILIVQALLSMWTILSGTHDPREFGFHQAKSALFDEGAVGSPNDRLYLDGRPIFVDVFITTYGEDIDVIRRTVDAALRIRGEHTTWILDDGHSDDVRDLASELGARYVRRLSSGGAKAGNVNHALSLSSVDYFAIFDADFVPSEEFLVETVPFFSDEHVAFVQTPQTYGNLHNVISRGAGYMQAVFYRFIQPGRNRFNAAFCVGTNVVFRRTAINDIGGIYTDSKSEDVWTSLMLHERGWRTIFIPMTLAIGAAPDTVEAYTKQQLRWATGGFEILLRHNPLSPKRKLTLDQRLQYLVTASFYLTGISPLLLLLVPPLEIFFDLRPVDLQTTVLTWVLFYAGFYLVQILLAFYTMGSFRWETLMLAAASFPIYVAALVNVLVGKEQRWSATGDKSKASSPFNFMIPQVLFFVFLLLTSVVAIWRDLGNGVPTLAMAWNVTNTFILGSFVVAAMRESSRQRQNSKARRVTAESPRTARSPRKAALTS
ncbi:glycosyltransferase family 2 protein [Marisediminicola antarctica]|uniref:Glycosyl transferase family 2 n=1 Tax=Marisediminicola antarctica TaxID=674079 RepID=A0A7L5AKB0_9MICO|nr:glycosyltransferase family 2 protein [Marisediminicola antarctica]QHO70506.1 glycosyl transferase family 2 [Marisediminicola antarctica]